jgi:hypothetical protein
MHEKERVCLEMMPREGIINGTFVSEIEDLKTRVINEECRFYPKWF